MKTQILQLERHDDSASVIDKVQGNKASRVLLVWPKHGRLFTRLLDLLLIQRAVRDAGAQLALVTWDEDVLDHAQNLGIPVFRSARVAEQIPWRRQRAKWVFAARDLRARADVENKKPGTKAARWQGRWGTVGRWSVFGLGVASILVLALFIIPQVTVHVSLQTEEQWQVLEIWAHPALTQINLSGGIPAKVLQTSIERQASTKTSGTILIPDQFARGVVQFTNLTDRPIDILAGTIVENFQQPPIQFRTTRDAYLIGKPGSTTQVSVLAIQAGSQGNLEAGQIRAVVGAPGMSISVQNPERTTGGGDIASASAEKADLEGLRNRLIAEMKENARKDMEKDLPAQSHLLLESLRLVKIQEETVDPAAGLPAEEVRMVIRAEFQAWSIRAEDLESLAQAVLDGVVETDKVPVTGSLQITTLKAPVLTDNQIRWQIKISRQVRKRLDSQAFIEHVAGKRPVDALRNLENTPGLTAAPIIELKPNWWPVLPLLPARMQVEVR